MNLPAEGKYSLDWLRRAGAQGLVADVTDRLGGGTVEIDYPSRGPRESRLKLLKIGEIKNCFPPKDIRCGDIVLIFNASAELIHAGRVSEDGRLLHAGGGKSLLSLAAYCARWRTAAGIKVLREPWWKYRYTKRECMVPMRDGTRLYTAVYEPNGLKDRPILLQRSPYPCCPFGSGGPGDIWDNLHMYADNGYIIVYQNVRGTYLSEGEFVNVRPLSAEIDEASDSYDTIEWLIHNTCNNGRVGIFGVSYPGFYATLASLCGHPVLKAVSPQAPVTDWWMGDDTHHNGAFLLADMYGFGGFFFRPKLNPTPDSRESVCSVPEGSDIYGFFRGRSMRQVWRAFGKELPFMDCIKNHPDYDDFWKERNPLRHLRNFRQKGAARGNQQEAMPAVLVVGGLYDAEDAWGALHTYRAYEDAGADCRFVYGPWTHGGWRKVDYFLEKIEYPFFAFHLEDKGAPPAWRELLLPTGLAAPGPVGETGPTPGRTAAEGSVNTEDASGTGGLEDAAYAGLMRFEDPAAGAMKSFPIAPGSYVSDPSEPVPYMESAASRREKGYMWAAQNFASGRPDVLCRTVQKPLKDTLWAVGPVKVHLRAKASGTDADFIVKLIDLSPDGTQTLVRAEVMPARYRHSFERPEPLEPGKAFDLDFTMVDICHCFAPGHGIMVQIQSSCFPLVAMNPQKFLKNPYTASRKDYNPCEIRILRGSGISLCVLP